MRARPRHQYQVNPAVGDQMADFPTHSAADLCPMMGADDYAQFKKADPELFERVKSGEDQS
jgi:hypothetical protein